MNRSIVAVMASVCVLALSLCLGCSHATTDPAVRTPGAVSEPAEKSSLEEAAPQLAEPEQEATSTKPRTPAENLISDPSLEDAELGTLPRGWSAYPAGASDFRYEVVGGGRTGNHCLQIEHERSGACVFANGVSPLDRTKRYALKGWVKFGGGNAKALIRFNYFHNGKWLGASDLIGVSSDQEGWQLLEKTDAADDFPDASQIWVSCNVEGSGKAWFDDLELVAYDREGLSADFDSLHSKDNLTSRLLVLDRWVGQWEPTTSHETTDASVRADETVAIRNVAKILDDRLVQSHWTGEDGDQEILSLLTYDDNSAAYRSWTFSSSGGALEFGGQWDDATSTLTLQLVPPAPGVTGSSITRFLDANTIETRLIVKDEAGLMTRDVGETLTRKSKTPASDIPPAPEATTTQQLPELEVLEYLLGDWRLTGTFFEAEWTPKQTEMTATSSWTRILNGQFFQSKIKGPEGIDHLILETYDAQRKCYRRWDFPSDGQASDSIGKWDTTAKTMTWSHTRDDVLTTTVTDRHVDADTVEYGLVIKDRNGKLYLHLEGKSTRMN